MIEAEFDISKQGSVMQGRTWIRMTKDDINALPIRRYQGRISVINTPESLDRAVCLLEKETVLGFDTETRPAFHARQHFFPSVLQLAGKEEVFIFQLKKKKLPRSLCRILANPDIIKAGVALARDISELKSLEPFESAGFADVGEIAKKIGLMNHGLRGLAAVLLKFRISKGAQTSNWSKDILTPFQIKYAATDAWVGRKLYFKLQEIIDKDKAT